MIFSVQPFKDLTQTSVKGFLRRAVKELAENKNSKMINLNLGPRDCVNISMKYSK